MSDNIGIRTYLEYTMEQESPALYHISVCLSITAAILSRRVWIAPAPEGKTAAPIYPNLYVVLVGPTSRLHKSSCCKKGKVLLDEFSEVRLLHTDITAEQLVVYLSEIPVAYIYAPELAVTLGNHAFQGKLPVYLTAYYDGDNPSYSTKTAGIYEIEPPSVNILGGSTKAWLRTGLSEEKGTSGYSARFLYVVMNYTERRSTGDYEVPEARLKMVDILHYVENLSGEIKATPEVWKWYEKWYNKFADELQKAPDDFMLGYMGRKPVHIWKLAICFCALRMGTMIEMQDVLDAKQYLDWLEPTVGQVYSPSSGNPYAGLDERILELIDMQGPLPEYKIALLLNRYAPQEQVMEMLNLLCRDNKLDKSGGLIRPGKEFEETIVRQPEENEVMGHFGLEYVRKEVKE